MMLIHRIFAAFVVLASAEASSTLNCCSTAARTRPGEGDLVVDVTGEHAGSYPDLSSAVAALEQTTSEQTIFLYPGTYSEQVYIPRLTGPLVIQGYTCDTHAYTENQVTITGNLSRNTPGLTNNDQTATVRLWSENVKVYNLNIANTFGQAATNGQALALSAQNTNQAFYGCQFTGYQDTIYANEGRQLYAHSYINGAVDFIFGLRAAAWFESCDIDSIGPGYVTANGRDAAENNSFYVFNKAHVSGTSGVGSTVLGRPWRQFSRVVFQDSWLGDVVKPEGWSVWDNTQPVSNVFYREYGNEGPGSIGPRANWAGQLDQPVQMGEILGEGFADEWWVDMEFLR